MNVLGWDRDTLVPSFEDGFTSTVRRAPTNNEMAATNSPLLPEVLVPMVDPEIFVAAGETCASRRSSRTRKERPFVGGYTAQFLDNVESSKGRMGRTSTSGTTMLSF